ncbi:M24 family metallopeptidase [Paraburkholderia diazotrophica]|uniref:Xaa-Pro dipeptidase n=1 Tax=Paraburkholderia diazotrophica TaxID=667676 RepID=A0A1H7EJJ3_9BURK|nr:Xaa-Pro peptidase family protein [Paraburkholderia diazotrophica]SEK14051.1 Xaa-Pro dipeptidase [Paraburkholderia diazotrophica]
MAGTNVAFTTEEYRRRLAKVQNEVQNRNLIGLLVHSPHNICYLAGFHTSGYFAYQVLFVPAEGEPLLLVRESERLHADVFSWLEIDRQAVYLDTEDPAVVTGKWLKELGWTGANRAIGVEKSCFNLPVRDYEKISATAESNTLIDASGLVNRVRLIKSPQEIEYARRAARTVDIGLKAGLEALAVGKTELEIAAAIQEQQILAGTEYQSLPNYVSSGDRIRRGHSTPTDKVIELGDLLKFEITGSINRYHAALMRTAIMGKPSDEILRVSELLITCQDRAFQLMKHGAVSGDVDAAVRQPVLKAGLRKSYLPRIGYSLGIGFPPVSGEWEVCDFMANDTWVLQAGMIFHMVVNANGISFSETMLVTESGSERLTTLPRELRVVQ